jgi:hypothetical protein
LQYSSCAKRIFSLLAAISLTACTTQSSSETKTLAKPNVLSRSEWKAHPPNGLMKRHTPRFITIHHTATLQKPAVSLAEKLRNLQTFSQNEGTLAGGKSKPAWPDVPYHFYIDCNGNIGEGRDVAFVGDTNTEYDPTGHLLVTLEGNFEVEQPTEAQMKSARELVAWLAKRYKIPAAKIASHKDYARTACPGKNLYNRLGEIRDRID